MQSRTEKKFCSYGCSRPPRPLPPIGGNIGSNLGSNLGSKNLPFFNPNYSHFQPQVLHNGTNGGSLFSSLNLSGSNGGGGSGFVNYVNGLGGGSIGGFTGNGSPPQLPLSPTSVLSNYSLSRNLNHLNLNLVPRTNR